ncbi:MAG: Hsp33 family molecular chaperone HslO [Succinivibrio sp.]
MTDTNSGFAEDCDTLLRFLFDNHKGVRGEILHMHQPCLDLLSPHSYPSCVKSLMLELAAAAELFCATLKDGSEVMLQIRGGQGSPLKIAIINTRPDGSFYGSASLDPKIPCKDDLPFASLAGGGGVLAITIFPPGDSKDRWQGIVPLGTESVAGALENYFKDSAQLPTRFFIKSDPKRAAAGGIMLQVIPEVPGNLDSLDHLGMLASTITAGELWKLSNTDILSRLFAREDVRVLPSRPIAFRCICSKERCEKALMSMDPRELEAIINEQGGARMSCQHCGRKYEFTKAELQALLARSCQ